MAPVEVYDDYYEILRVSNTAALCDVTSSYRRLARKTHPDKNPNDSCATAAFQLLNNAYETIKDPDARRLYDLKWVSIRRTQTAKREAENRQARAGEGSHEERARENVRTQNETKARQERLQFLEAERAKYESKIFEFMREVRKIKAQIKRLKEEDDECMMKEKAKNSWWAYVTPSTYTQAKESEENEQIREREALQRLNSSRIHEANLSVKEGGLQKVKDSLDSVNARIAAEKMNEEREADANAAKAKEEQRREQQRRWQEDLNEQRKQDQRNELRRRQAQEELQRKQEQEDLRRKQAQEELRRKQEQEKSERLRREQTYHEAPLRRERQERLRRAREAGEQQARLRKAEAEAEAARARQLCKPPSQSDQHMLPPGVLGEARRKPGLQ